MKKFIIFVLSIFLLLPVGVNAEKEYSKEEKESFYSPFLILYKLYEF